MIIAMTVLVVAVQCSTSWLHQTTGILAVCYFRNRHDLVRCETGPQHTAVCATPFAFAASLLVFTKLIPTTLFAHTAVSKVNAYLAAYTINATTTSTFVSANLAAATVSAPATFAVVFTNMPTTTIFANGTLLFMFANSFTAAVLTKVLLSSMLTLFMSVSGTKRVGAHAATAFVFLRRLCAACIGRGVLRIQSHTSDQENTRWRPRL